MPLPPGYSINPLTGLPELSGGGGSGSITKQVRTITGNGVDTVFTVAHTFGNSDLIETVKNSNGVKQFIESDPSDTNISYRFAVPPSNGEVFNVVILGESSSAPPTTGGFSSGFSSGFD